MKTSFALVFCVLAILLANGQTNRIDSLQNAFSSANADTTRARILAELGSEWLSISVDSAYHYLNQAHQVAMSLGYQKGIAISLTYLGRCYQQSGDYGRALESFHSALKVNIDHEYPPLRIVTLLDLGKLYSAMRMFSGSNDLFRKEIAYYRKSLAAFNSMKDAAKDSFLEDFEPSLFIMMGQAYANRHTDSLMLDSAAFYFEKALDKAKGEAREVEILALEGIALVYFQRGRYAEAQQTGRLLLKASRSQSPYHEVMALQQVAHLHQKTSFDSGYFYLQRALEGAKKLEISFPFLQEIVWGQLGQLHFHHQRYLDAIEAFSQERRLAKAHGSKINEIGYLLTSEAYKALGDYEQALHFKTRYHELVDSLFNTETSARLEKLEADFASEKQKNEMLLLQQEASAKSMMLQRQQNRQIIYVLIILVLLLSALLIFYRVRLLQKAKRDQARLFSQIDQLKSRFFAHISHEFRTPLTLLMAPLQTRMQIADKQEDKLEFQLMFRSANRLLTLVNQLLELARFDAGTQQLRVVEQDVVAFLGARAHEFQALATSREIHFSFHHDSPTVPLFFDADKVHKIVTNLLSNAFKFTPPGGQVQLKIQTLQPTKEFREGAVEITVADTGPGIGPEHVPHIFDRFYQVDSQVQRLFEGSGVGLALAKELTELHRGKISVASNTGTGTIFSVRLPLGKIHLPSSALQGGGFPVYTTIAEMPAAGPVIPSTNDNSDVVLVIEDHADLRDYLTLELSKHYVVLQASNGEEGLKTAFEKIPSLILCDWMMPGINGPTVCTQLREDERTSHIPFILLTARDEATPRMEGFRHGADDFITKPFSLEELMVRIQNQIDVRKRLQRKYASHAKLVEASTVVSDSLEEKFIKKAVTLVEANMEDSDFSVETFAREMALSSVQLYRKLTALTGLSPNEFIRELRLQRAAQLLSQRAGNIAEIGYQCGFNNLSYFARVFKEKYGTTPSEYRKKEESLLGIASRPDEV